MAAPGNADNATPRSHKVDVEEGWTTQVRAVRAYNRRLLFSTLDSIEGSKTIIWSEKLMKRVNVFATGTELKDHGVVNNHILDKMQPSISPNILFFVEKSMTEANKLIEYLKKNENANSYNHVFFIPDEWYAARQKLKDQKNIWEKLETVRALPLSWLPSEGDIISLGEPTLPSRLLLNGDWTVLHRCACALHELERMVGRPLILHTKGKWSQDIANMLVKMRDNKTSTGVDEPSRLAPATGLNLTRLVLIDRWVDPLAPLLTPHTYAAMLDDEYGIGLKDSVKILKKELEATTRDNNREDDTSPDSLMEMGVNDEMFHRLKHLHIAQLGREVADIVADVTKDSEKDTKNMSVAEIQLFVKKLPVFLYRKGRLAQHVKLNELLNKAMHRKYEEIYLENELVTSPSSDKVIPSVEDEIVRANNLHYSLRLIAIQSIAAEGLKSSVLQTYRKMIFQSFGVDALCKFVKMQKIGLIREKNGARFVPSYTPMFFSQQKKEYKLIPEDVQTINPTDSAYAYEYYASLIVRMIEEGVRIKWVGWNTPKGNTAVERENGDNKEEETGGTGVFVVGGVTRAEVAGLRLIKNIGLIASSSIVNRKNLIDSLTNIFMARDETSVSSLSFEKRTQQLNSKLAILNRDFVRFLCDEVGKDAEVDLTPTVSSYVDNVKDLRRMYNLGGKEVEKRDREGDGRKKAVPRRRLKGEGDMRETRETTKGGDRTLPSLPKTPQLVMSTPSGLCAPSKLDMSADISAISPFGGCNSALNKTEKDGDATLKVLPPTIGAPSTASGGRKRAIRGGGPGGDGESVVFRGAGETSNATPTITVKPPPINFELPKGNASFWNKSAGGDEKKEEKKEEEKPFSFGITAAPKFTGFNFGGVASSTSSTASTIDTAPKALPTGGFSLFGTANAPSSTASTTPSLTFGVSKPAGGLTFPSFAPTATTAPSNTEGGEEEALKNYEVLGSYFARVVVFYNYDEFDRLLDPYSCKMVQSDKKQWKKDYEPISSQRQALSAQEEELGLSPVGRRLRHLSESSRTDDCEPGFILADSISARTLFDLIAVLNSTFPDYDFSDRKSADFALVPIFETVQQKVDEKLSSAVFNYGAVRNDLWSTIKTEIKPEECTIYTFKADYTSDPFSEDGCFWYFNYFLHNKNLNRLLFLSCRALSASHSADVSSEQLWDLEED